MALFTFKRQKGDPIVRGNDFTKNNKLFRATQLGQFGLTTKDVWGQNTPSTPCRIVRK